MLLRTVKSMIVGLGVTLSEVVRRPITELYPEEKPQYPPGSRSIPVLKTNEESGLLNCTSCGLCERNCPPSVIHITQAVDAATGKKKPWPEQFVLDYDHCMVCNICIEVCPFDALEMADCCELGSYQVGDLTFDQQALVELWKTARAVRVHDGIMMPDPSGHVEHAVR